MQEVDWNQKIKEALDRTEFMALSTADETRSWVCPVAFSYDESLNLYFISMMETQHVQNILKNEKVSVAIYKTERFGDGDVIGLQLNGSAKHVTDPDELSACSGYYFGRSDSNDGFKDSSSAHDNEEAKWQFFKITPAQLWYFNSADFSEKRVEVPLTELSVAAPN